MFRARDKGLMLLYLVLIAAIFIEMPVIIYSFIKSFQVLAVRNVTVDATVWTVVAISGISLQSLSSSLMPWTRGRTALLTLCKYFVNGGRPTSLR